MSQDIPETDNQDTPVKCVDFARPETCRSGRPARREDDPWTALALVGQLGLVVALCIAGSLGVGVYLDRCVGGTGVLIVVALLIGLGAAAVAAWNLLKQELPWNR